MKPGLTRWQMVAILGISLVVFFFIAGPIWRRPWSIDRSVWLSYFVIPILVAGLLLASRRWSLGGFLLGTIELVLFKFGITYLAATILWATAGEPPRPSGPPIASPAAQPAPPPTPIAPETTGSVAGTAAPGALVFVESGLESFVFASRKDEVHMEDSGAGFVPEVVAVQVGQPLLMRSTDGRTHTLHAKEDQTGALRNIAVLASGAPRSVTFSRPLGLVSVQCAVHPGERPSHMAILAHPFFASVPPDGHFKLLGIPAGHIRVSAFDAQHGRHSAELDVRPREQAEIALDR